MKRFSFSKMQGAGNDFVVIDCSEIRPQFSPEEIRRLCSRQFGIGADGLILLTPSGNDNNGENGFVRMDFFNCDGSAAEMCGNGLRCAVCFSRKHGLSKYDDILFQTDSGVLKTKYIGENTAKIELRITEPFREIREQNGQILYKGSVGVPHAVLIVPSVDNVDVETEGRRLRYSEMFAPEGTNVDFIEIPSDSSVPVRIRTYERGVEGETLACGTGIVSAAHVLKHFLKRSLPLRVQTKSGEILTVLPCTEGNEDSVSYFLEGPAYEVFTGTTADLTDPKP